MAVLEKISEIVQTYNSEKESISLENLQGLRDDLAISYYELHNLYSSTKIEAERREYIRKLETSKNTIELKGTRDDNGKLFSREAILAKNYIDCKEFYDAEHSAHEDYERVRHIAIATTQILNTMSSRISMLNRNP